MNFELPDILNWVAMAVMGVIGWLTKKQFETFKESQDDVKSKVTKIDDEIRDLPEKYVPRKELHERWQRMEQCIAYTEQGIKRIENSQRDLQVDIKQSIQRIHDKIEEISRNISNNSKV